MIDLHLGDCLDVMAEMEPDSVDTVITDCPYGLGFMGKDWDHGIPGVRFWAEMLRVAKPGAMLLAFGGTRTHHRLMCAIEDAGWEIRDCMMWIFGSGFPKSHSIHKATGLDEWEGYGTALKPAFEPIVLAMKPRDGTFANNALVHGVAGLWIDGGRIPTNGDGDRLETERKNRHADFGSGPRDNQVFGGDARSRASQGNYDASKGRWPANLLLSHAPGCKRLGTRKVRPLEGHRPNPVNVQADGHIKFNEKKPGYQKVSYTDPDGMETVEAWDCVEGCPIRLLGEQSGELKSGNLSPSHNVKPCSGWSGGSQADRVKQEFAPSTGTAARFFYCAKASRKERNAGLEGMEERPSQKMGDGLKIMVGHPSGNHGNTSTEDRRAQNHHPTVKPLDLMRYLCKLTKTPTGGIVLDPFMGSGTTGIAAIMEGREFIGIELDADYYEIAQRRIAWAGEQAIQLELIP